MAIPLAPGGHWTIEDLALLPDDGNRYEIFDGSLLVTPPPDLDHVGVQHRLTYLLNDHAPPDLVAVSSGAGVSVRGGSTFYVPDLVVIQADLLRRKVVALDPGDVHLVVEVLSPGNKGRDLVLKRNDYAIAGIPDYWIVDREVRTVTALTLDKDTLTYREQAVARAGGPWRASRPFDISLDPGDFC